MAPPPSDLQWFSPLPESGAAAGKATWWVGCGPEEGDDGGGGGAVDHFDRLPDSVLLLIFNKIGDVKALGRCSAVSRRFGALVPLVDNVLVRVDCVISDDGHNASSTGGQGVAPHDGSKARGGLLSRLGRLVLGGIVRPLQSIGQFFVVLPSVFGGAGIPSAPCSRAASDHRMSHSSSSAAASDDISHHSPAEVLRNFKEIRRLRIELPAGELGVDDGVLLKWKADFGSTLNSCVILSASSVKSSSSAEKPSSSASDKSSNADGGAGGGGDAGEGFCGAAAGEDSGTPESFYSNGSLKRRVLWTIRSLIAASARHYLLQPIVAEHGTLERLDLTDGDGQGVLEMDRRQLAELRSRPVPPSAPSQRTPVPALHMSLWYAQELELAGGKALQGATLVAIRPCESSPAGQTEEDLDWVKDALEEPYGSAVRQLVKRRKYCLEMNSF